MKKISVTIFFFFLGWSVHPPFVSAQQDLPSEIISYADIVLYNGKILTADDNFGIVEATAIRDGKFLAVGKTDQILKMAGPNTRKIDLAGKTVTPGFIETHAHGWAGNVATSASRNSANLAPGYDHPAIIFATQDVGLQKIKEAVSKFPPGKWIWTSTIRTTAALTLTAQQLDTVSPNNPLTITISPQEAVVNSKALKEMIDNSPVILQGGGLMKGKDGKPNGQIRGNAFGTMFYEFFPWVDLQPMIEAQKRQLARNVATGITTRIGRAQGLAVTILNELHTRGELPLRVRFAHEFLRMLPDAERFFKRMGNMVGLGDDMFKIIGTVEQQIDGGSRVGAILTKQPKLRMMEGAAYGLYGANYWGEDQGYIKGTSPRDNIILAGKYGWPIVSLHSYGDKVVEMELDAFEEGMKHWPPALTKHRWVLDHNWMHDADT
ncbi:MAG TPA: amidohydrolase family protein, partial [Chthonomonadales bacterium]|nr:amidohydrolase family protein [Chthonomonadales bacterium]